MSLFDEVVAEILRAEGGLLVDGGEGGGAANMGITLTTYKEYHKNENLTVDDLTLLTPEEATQIYRELFWDRLGLDNVTGKLSALLLLDQACNRGRAGLRKLLIASLNWRLKLALDTETPMKDLIPLVNSVPDREFFRRFIADAQIEYVKICQRKPEKMKNLRGWLVRTHNLLKFLV